MSDFIHHLPKLQNFDPLGFCQNPITRHSIKRGENEISAAYDDIRAKTYLLQKGKALLKQTAKGFDPLFTMSEANQFQLSAYQEVLLGYQGDRPRFAMEVLEPLETLEEGLLLEGLRTLAMDEMIEAKHLGALALANGLLSWHQSHQFCAKCGTKSEVMDGGYRRLCPSCHSEHFPRTDPVVIMLIVKEGHKEDHCLLGRGHNFEEPLYSALAGFMEPGETIEDAVRRETYEEAGIRVGDVHYLTSQPWPMPHSLMIGCIGVAKDYEINIDPQEIMDCQWFSTDAVKSMRDGTHPKGYKVPKNFAIASALINYWLDFKATG